MCKHILIRDVTKQDLTTVGLFASMTRDNDGFGAIVRNKNGEISAFKSLSLAEFYLKIGAVIERGNVQDLVVHHRTSTNEMGIDYAHPFQFDGHWLTHNGVVSVPGNHATKTKNDSEALLHHLIKTNYETRTISGYFSCFILSKDETVVLVDAIAPIYSDGRVYCSHKLNDGMEKLELVKVTISRGSKTVVPIEVTKSDYGSNVMHLSLGQSAEPEASEAFLDVLSEYDFKRLDSCRNQTELLYEIEVLAMMNNIELKHEDLSWLIEYFGLDVPRFYQE